jgi:hypothetical protein
MDVMNICILGLPDTDILAVEAMGLQGFVHVNRSTIEPFGGLVNQ